MHKLNQVHFTSWTPGGIQSTFSRRRALSLSMLSSTTTWVTLGDSELSVCPPFWRICFWKIWHLAFPIPAGKMYSVTPLKVFPGTEERNAQWTNMLQICCFCFGVISICFSLNLSCTALCILSLTLTHTNTVTNLWHHIHLASSLLGVHPFHVTLWLF